MFISNKGLLKNTDSTKFLNFEILPKVPTVAAKISSLVHLTSLWRFKERNPAHRIRAYNLLGSRRQKKIWACEPFIGTDYSIWKKCLIKVISKRPLYECLLFSQYLTRVFMLRAHSYLFREKLQLVLIPYKGHINENFGIYVWLAKKLKIKSVALQENWDNLASKSFILDEPDVFCVWGQQSSGHLRAIQRLSETRIYIAGSPRFDRYWEQDTNPPKVSLPDGTIITIHSPYILVAGIGSGLDHFVVSSLMEALASLGNETGEIKVVYRPHPESSNQSKNLQLISNKYSDVLFDVGDNARRFGHRESLIQNSLLTVCQLSTMTLETLLVGKNTIAPLFSDNLEVRYGYKRIVNEWVHLAPIAASPRLKLVEDKLQLKLALTQSLEDLSGKHELSDWVCRKGAYLDHLKEMLDKEYIFHDSDISGNS